MSIQSCTDLKADRLHQMGDLTLARLTGALVRLVSTLDHRQSSLLSMYRSLHYHLNAVSLHCILPASNHQQPWPQTVNHTDLLVSACCYWSNTHGLSPFVTIGSLVSLFSPQVTKSDEVANNRSPPNHLPGLASRSDSLAASISHLQLRPILFFLLHQNTSYICRPHRVSRLVQQSTANSHDADAISRFVLS